MKNRIGKMKVSGGILNDPDILRILYSQFFPYKIIESHVYPRNYVFCIFGYSDSFEEINEGDEIPEYEATFSGNAISFEKKYPRNK